MGLRTLAGGVDGVTVSTPASEPTTTMLLTHERLAESAAWWVVESDVADRSPPRLFDVVDPSVKATEEEAREQIENLVERVLSQDPTEERTDALLALLSAVNDTTGEPEAAWAALVSALIRDPDFLLY